MLIPGPGEYLKSHAIAFLGGVLTVTLARLYAQWKAESTKK